MFTVPKDDILAHFKGKRIAVLAGGLSDERDVSLRSGSNVFAALSSFNELDVELIDVGKDIARVLIEKKIDYAYNTLHGTYGEDGVMQGILEMLGVGYTGEDVLTSAICMDKVKAKEVLAYHGVQTPAFARLSHVRGIEETRILHERGVVSTPCVLKPVANGSSVGVVLVNNVREFEKARKGLPPRDYFIEEYIKGDEVTVGVMRQTKGLYTFPILKIMPKNTFYDYEAKYTKGMTAFEIPAKLDNDVEKAVIAEVKKAYDALDCEGICRIDVMIREDGTPFVIENNTQPGMTDTSDIPEMARSVGIPFEDIALYTLGYKALANAAKTDGEK